MSLIDSTASHSAQIAALHAIFKLRQRWRHKPSGRIARVSRVVDGHLIVIMRFEDARPFPLFSDYDGETMIDPRMTRADRMEYHSAKGRLRGNARLQRAINSGHDLWERV